MNRKVPVYFIRNPCFYVVKSLFLVGGRFDAWDIVVGIVVAVVLVAAG